MCHLLLRVVLSWLPVIGQPANGIITGYRLAHRRSDDSNAFFFGVRDPFQFRDLPAGPDISLEVAGLRPFLKYEFQVELLTVRIGSVELVWIGCRATIFFWMDGIVPDTVPLVL